MPDGVVEDERSPDVKNDTKRVAQSTCNEQSNATWFDILKRAEYRMEIRTVCDLTYRNMGATSFGSESGTYISNMGLTGFDVSNAVRVCDPSFSDSLNGETTELPMSSSLSPPDLDQMSEESS